MFRLSKWYLDGVADDGSAGIAYDAELRWLGLGAGYSGWIDAPSGEAASQGHRFRRAGGTGVSVDGTELVWRPPGVPGEGRWRPRSAGSSHVLYARRGRSVFWDCRAPRCDVVFSPPGGAGFTGLGYAERLTLTLPPWRLPIDTLVWGRFVSDRSSVAWIEWRGTEPLRLVVDGTSVFRDLSVSDDGIAYAGRRIEITPHRLLRTGRAMGEALSRGPIWGRLVPRRIRRGVETKWLARGSLTRDDRTAEEGWVVHETVTFR